MDSQSSFEMPIQLVPDLAVAESEDSRSDALEFISYASVIARIVRGTRGPFTIGVFGEWGMGKTSLMRLIAQQLISDNFEGSDQVIVPVWFNAWMFERVQYPIIPLIKSIIEAIELRQQSDDSIAASSKTLLDALKALIKASKIKGQLSLPGGGAEVEVDPSVAYAAYKEHRSGRESVPENQDSYEQIFDALHKISDNVVPKNITILVLIDDLDRCFPENAVRLLESIKLILSQPGFIFALGASRIVIEEYLQSKYEKQFGIQHFNGRAYLDKMIQLTFDIPPHASRIDTFTDEIISSIENEITRNELHSVNSIISQTCHYNPRAIIRFINRLITDSAIYKLKNSSVEKATIPVGFFAVTRSLQQVSQDLYGLLVSGEDEEDREYCAIISRWNDHDIKDWKNYGNGIADAKRPKDYGALRLADPQALKQIATYLANNRTLKFLLWQEMGRRWLADHPMREASVSFLLAQPSENVMFSDDQVAKAPEAYRPYTQQDDVYEEAVRTVIELGRASTSLLQRRLRIGYSRAARIIEEMEQKGIVAPSDGSRPREVLISSYGEFENLTSKIGSDESIK